MTLESSKGQSENGPQVTDFETNQSQKIKVSRPAAKEVFTQKLPVKGKMKYPMKGSDCQSDTNLEDYLT